MFDRKAYNKEYRSRNKANAKKYREENKDQAKAYTKQWYEENRDYHKIWRKKNKDYHKNYHKRYYEDNKDKIREGYQKLRLKKLNLTEQQYQEMCLRQEHRCAICRRHRDEFKRDLHVDHDHTTGKIRGLLCVNCNTALGKLNDNPTLFERAIVYLME